MLVGPEQQKKLQLTLDHIVQTNKHWRKSEKEGTFICYGANLFLASLQLGMIMGLQSGNGDVNRQLYGLSRQPVQERPFKLGAVWVSLCLFTFWLPGSQTRCWGTSNQLEDEYPLLRMVKQKDRRRLESWCLCNATLPALDCLFLDVFYMKD